MNTKKYESLVSNLLETNLIGPEFIGILSNSFKYEEIYIYLKLEVLNIGKKELLSECFNYSNEMLDNIVYKIRKYINEYSDSDQINKILNKNNDSISNEFSCTIPICGRKEK